MPSLRLPLLSRSLLTTLPAALALLGLVLLLAVTGQLPTSPAPVQAQTQPGVLVSNFGFTSDNVATSTYNTILAEERTVATQFTTGPGATSGAYSLSSIAVKSVSGSATSTINSLRAELWSAATTANTPPHAKLYDLTVPDPVPGDGNEVIFTAPAHATLATSTKYYLVVYTTDATNFQMQRTNADGEDGVSAAGWEIEDGGAHSVLARSPDSGSWVHNSGYDQTTVIRVRGAEATSAVAVSNFGQTVLSGFGEATSTIGAFDSSQQYVVSTQFTTGAGTNTLASIAVKTPAGQATSTDGVLKAELWSASSSTGNPPDAKLYDLKVPDVSGGAQTVTFTAPPNATLAENAKHYLVVFTTDSTKFTMQVTNSDSEDAGAAAGWSIADGGPWRKAASTPDVGNWAQDTHDQYGDTGLIQVSVYEATEGSADLLVSNLGQDSFGGYDTGSRVYAPGFTTGSNAGGYTLTSIEINLLADPTAAQSGKFRAELWSASTSGGPDSKLYDLTVPSDMPAGVVSFAAPANTTLAASTTYHAVLYTTDTTVLQLDDTDTTDEDAGGAAGWSIVDTGYDQASSGQPDATAAWNSYDYTLGLIKIAVKGAQAQQTLSSNADLSDLTAESSADGGISFAALTGAATLAPAFDAATTSYRATVGNDVTHVRLTPTLADTSSSVTVGKTGALNTVASGSASDAIALGVGDNDILVGVTDSNSNTRDYTVTVRRVPAGSVWYATLVPAAISPNGFDGFGCSSIGSGGGECSTLLTDASITHATTTYPVSQVFDYDADQLQVIFEEHATSELAALSFCIGDTAYDIAEGLNPILELSTDVGWAEGVPVSLSIGASCTEEAGAGDLDPEFSAASAVTTAVGSEGDVGEAMAVQSDGKVVVAGYSSNGSDLDFAVVRYTADGAPDPTFGTGGKVTTAVGSTSDVARAVAIQSDGKIVVAGYSHNGTDDDFAVVRYTAAGVLDTGFGTSGIATTTIGSNPDAAHSVAIQSDGKIVAAGSSGAGTDNDFAVVRYTAAGALDTGFGTSGIASTTIGSYNDQARAVAIQSDGKIVAAGSSSNGTDTDFAVVRYTAAGALDTGFGTSGIATTTIGSHNDQARAVAIQTDGKIVTAGYSNNGSDDDFALARYTTAGALDTTFSDDGKVTTGIGAGAERANAVAMRADGAILAAGYSNNGTFNDFALAAYDADGEPAAVLDGPGWLSTDIGPGSDIAHAVAVDGDGNIVASGRSSDLSDVDAFAVARYDADGTLDTGFDSDGIATTTIGSFGSTANAMSIQSDGKIVAAGYSVNDSGDKEIALIRHDADGSLDTGFGTTTTGIATTDIGSGEDEANEVAIQSDGKIVVAGYSHNGSDNDFAVVRYTSAGALDTGFGTTTTGIVTTDIGSSSDDVANAVAIQSDGKIVVAGSSNNGSNDDFAVVRYTSAGALDTGFGTSTTGIVTTGIGSSSDVALSVAIQPDGKIVVAGYSFDSNGLLDTAVVRFNADGSLDTGFGTGGKVTTAIGSGDDYVSSVAVQSDGKIIAAGYVVGGGGSDFALVRYHADGWRDTGFGSDGNGKVITDFTSMDEQATAVAIQPDDNKIVVAGTSERKAFVVARYLSGELEPSVSLSASPNPVPEGSSVTITATLSPSLSSAVTIPLALTPGTAGSGEYGTLASIAIASGQTTGTGTITTTADTEVEDDETFTVSLDEDNLPAGVVAGSTYSVEITIDDDDVPAARTNVRVLTIRHDRLALVWDDPSGETIEGTEVHYTSAPKTGSGAVADDAAVQTVSAAAGWFAADPALRRFSIEQYIYSLTTDTDYRVRVRAVSAAGPGPWKVAEGTPANLVPVNACVRTGAPYNGTPAITMSASVPHDLYPGVIRQVRVTPQNPSDAWPTRDAFNHSDPVGSSGTSQAGYACDQRVLYNLTAGESYQVQFHLRTIDGSVVEKSTEPITVTVWDVPGKPAGVSATTGAGSGRLDVSWTAATSTGFAGNDANVDGDFDDAVDDAPATITDYRVRWRVKDTDTTNAGDQPGSWSSGESAGADDTSHAVSGLAAGEEYEVQVRALNGVNPGSDWSDAAAGTASSAPSVSLSASPNPVDEGSSVTVTATLSKALTANVTIPLTLTAGTAESGDYGTLANITISSGQTTGTGTISANHDTDADDETFTVELGALPSEVGAGSPSSVLVTITDDEKPTVSLSASPNPVTEGSAVTITATLAASLSSDVAIPLTLTAGTADTGDFGTLASITVSAGQTTGTGEIATNHDSGEDDETFTVALDTANLPSEVLEGSPNSVLVTISDDEGIPSVSLSASPNPVDEGSSVTVTATLSKTLTSSVTVPLTLTAGTAESGDYGTLASITVSSGQTTGTGAIRTNQDRDTDDETFTVSLGTLPSGVRSGSASSVEVTITDDDKAEVSLEASPNPVDEGNAVTITARLSKALPEAVTIPIGLAAFTAEDGDYGALESITVVAGRTSGTGTITTVRDEDEDDDGFTVTVVDPIPSSLLLGYPFYVDITIRDDGPLRLELAASALRPGEGGSARLTATLNHPAPVGGARVRFGADGRGDSPASPLGDFTLEPAGEGQHDSEWMVIAEGERRATATLRVVNDTEPEDDETLVVWVRGDWTDDVPELELTIPANDGGGSGPAAWIDAEPNPVDEGRDVTVRVRLTEALGAEATIPLTLSRGTAEAGDYGTLASITIAAGATVGTGVIATVRDADGEDETFTVRLGRMPSGVRAGTASSVLVTIDDLDGPRAWLEVEPNPVAEGSAITVTAKLEEALSRSVTIPVSVERVTSESGDHGVLSSIVIASGRTEGTGRITTRRDTDGDDETFTVSLGASLPSGVRAGHPESVEVVIADEGADGPAAGVSLSASPNPVPEGESVTVTATLTEALTRSVTIPVSVSAGTAESGDHGTLAGIRIASGATSGTGAISTRADSDTGDETFTVSLGTSLPSGILASSPSSVTVTIADSGGDAPGRVRSLRVTAGEGRLDLAWSAPSSGAVTAYETQYRERGASGWTTLYESDYSDTAAAIVGLSNGTRYDVRVRASNDHGEGAWATSSGAPASGNSNSNGLRGLSVRVSDSPDGAYRALSLRPSFSSSVTAYTTTAPAGTTHARVRVSASSPTALILVDGHEVASGSESPAVHVSSGAPVWIAVIPADGGEAKEYSVTITIP